MSEYYLGQIMMTAFGFAQKGFAQCNGQLLPLNQNTALFSLLGTVYGGDGRTTFALPDLRSRTPVGAGPSYDPNWQPPPTAVGQKGGVETVTLTTAQMPGHNHVASVSSATATYNYPDPTLMLGTADPATALLYGAASNLTPLGAGPLAPTGGGQPHPNIQPYQAINFNIALQGVFPSRQ